MKWRSIQDNLHLIRTVLDKVNSGSALISLDKSKAFDRVDPRFLREVLEAAGFGQTFVTWIRLLYANPGVMVEVNQRKSDPFSLTRSIQQGYPLSPELYVLALEPFLRKLKANPILRGITLPEAIENARYSAYADDVSVIVSDTAEIVKVDREIEMYESVTGAKIYRVKLVGLRLGSWMGVTLPFRVRSAGRMNR